MKNVLNTGASIITNFGCDVGCIYCIWKQHPLNACYTTIEHTDWNKLRDFIAPYHKISVSGGGDPFYNYNTNKYWFDILCGMYNGNIDIHTSKILSNNELQRFNKIVIHFNYERFKTSIKQLKTINNPLRIVFVITKSLTKSQINDIIEETDKIKCQVSFRELYNNTIDTVEINNYIKSRITGLDQIMLVKQGDYNKYFMPDNNVWDRFMKG